MLMLWSLNNYLTPYPSEKYCHHKRARRPWLFSLCWDVYIPENTCFVFSFVVFLISVCLPALSLSTSHHGTELSQPMCHFVLRICFITVSISLFFSSERLHLVLRSIWGIRSQALRQDASLFTRGSKMRLVWPRVIGFRLKGFRFHHYIHQ